MSHEDHRTEARLYGIYWDDGLLDLLCGIALLAIGAGWWFDQVVLAAVCPGLLVPLWAPLRQRIVEPRAGYVEFSQERQGHTRTGVQVTILLGVGTLLLGVGLYFYMQRSGSVESLVGVTHYIAGLPAALLALGAVIAAQITSAHRFRAYALLLLLASATTIAMGWGPAMPMLAGGIGVVVSGLVLMSRFLRASAEWDGVAT